MHIFGNVLMVNNRCHGRCYVKKLIPLCTFLKFRTHLNLARSFQNAFDKCLKIMNLIFSRNSIFHEHHHILGYHSTLNCCCTDCRNWASHLSRNKWLLVFLCSEKVPWTKKKYLERELKLSLILSLLWLHMGVVLVVEFSLYISTFLLINNNIIQIFSALSAVAMASVLGCAQILKEGKPSEKKFSQTSAMPRFSWFFSTRNGQNQLNVSLNTTTPW